VPAVPATASTAVVPSLVPPAASSVVVSAAPATATAAVVPAYATVSNPIVMRTTVGDPVTTTTSYSASMVPAAINAPSSISTTTVPAPVTTIATMPQAAPSFFCRTYSPPRVKHLTNCNVKDNRINSTCSSSAC